MTPHPSAIFDEVQSLREQKLSLLMLAGGVFMVGFFAYAVYRQIILGIPVGDEPMGDNMLLGFGAFYVVLGLLLLLLFVKGRLLTEVRPDGVYVQFVPFHRRFKHIQPDEWRTFQALTYRPIRDFGGFGVRVGPKGRAYNVRGNQGVYFELKSGKNLLIGSQKTASLAAAIQSIVSSGENR